MAGTLPAATFNERKTVGQQHSLMKFDPATGEQKPYPSHADQWRTWHGKAKAWLFNPWSGERRDADDVGSDPFGFLILPPDETLYTSTENTERGELKKVAGDLNRLRARIEGVLWPNSGMAHGSS